MGRKGLRFFATLGLDRPSAPFGLPALAPQVKVKVKVKDKV